MDSHRVILAVVLSLAVLMGWSYFFQPTQQTAPPEQQDPTETAAPEMETAPAAPSAGESLEAEPLIETFQAVEGKEVTVDTPLYTAVFSSSGGILKSFRLKNYDRSIEPGSPPVNLVTAASSHKGPMGLLVNGRATWRGGDWAEPGQGLDLSEDETGELAFTGMVDGVQVRRVFTFDADSYLIEEKLRLHNGSDKPLAARVGFSVAAADMVTNGGSRYNRTKVSWYTPEGKEDEDDVDDLAKGVVSQQGVLWGAVQSNYFMAAAAPQESGLTFKTKHEDEVYRVAMELPETVIDPGITQQKVCNYYFGPVDEDRLEDAPSNLEAVVTYGWFDFISKPLLEALKFFQGYVHNYGVAIIILTIIIKIIFWPLSHKSYKSMNKMKKIQPLMAEVREKYKDDRQKMNEEMMRLYKTYKVNPAGGCLPMLLQIPVFIGLYQALLYSIELRHAAFIGHVPFTDIIWLADLSTKDPFYVTPVIMGATMFLQQKMTPSPGDPTQAKLMLMMPVIFTFVFLTFPAGLVVYWLANNVLSIAQQWLMIRKQS
jgi:YidC/Oxa1 family membrane protein insertase